MTENNIKILIVKPSALGDIVMALPVLSALRKKYPHSKISWLVRPEFADILRHHRFVDDVIIFDRKFLGKAWYNPKAFKAIFSLIKKIREANFDMTIDIQGLFRTAGLCRVSGAKKRFGMADGREFAPFLYNYKIKSDKQTIHMVDYYLKVVEAAGGDISKVDFSIFEEPKAKEYVDDLLCRNKLTRGNYVLLMPGSAHQDKCWPVDRFAAIADEINKKFGLSVVTIGSSSEKQLCENLCNIAKTKVFNFAGRTNISQLVSLINGAALAITNDTGPGHIAVALNIDVIFLFGPSNPLRIGPYKKDDSFIAVSAETWGFKFRSKDPRYDIKSITIKQVCEKISQKLHSKSRLSR